MRKFLALPLFMVYFFAITGVAVHHACCIPQQEKAAMACGMEEPMSCCSNHQPKPENTPQLPKNCDQNVQLVKVQLDQFCEKFIQTELVSLQIAPLPNLGFYYGQPAFKQILKKTNLPNAPPGRFGNIPLYKLHQRFTFYG